MGGSVGNCYYTGYRCFIFGTKRLKGMGSDLGSAIKGFKKAVNENEQDRFRAEKHVEEKDTADPISRQSDVKEKS